MKMSNIITLCSPDRSDFNSHQALYRDGIELEKGVIISQDFLERNEELFKKYLQIFSAYPDVYLDIIKPEASNFNLFPFQREFSCAPAWDIRSIYITAARATSKTFLSILAKYLQCCFVPGHRGFIVAPNKNPGRQNFKTKDYRNLAHLAFTWTRNWKSQLR